MTSISSVMLLSALMMSLLSHLVSLSSEVIIPSLPFIFKVFPVLFIKRFHLRLFPFSVLPVIHILFILPVLIIFILVVNRPESGGSLLEPVDNPVLGLRNSILVVVLLMMLLNLLRVLTVLIFLTLLKHILLLASPILPVVIGPVIKLFCGVVVEIGPVELLPVIAFPVFRVKFVKPFTLIFLIPVLPAFRNTITDLLVFALLRVSPLDPSSVIPGPSVVVFEISPVEVVPVITFPVFSIEPGFPGKLVLSIPLFEAPWLIIALFLIVDLVYLLLLFLGPFLPLVIIPLAVVFFSERRPVEFFPIVTFPVISIKVLKEVILIFFSPLVKTIRHLRFFIRIPFPGTIFPVIIDFINNDPFIIFDNFVSIVVLFGDRLLLLLSLVDISLLSGSPFLPVFEVPLIEVVVLQISPVEFLPGGSFPISRLEPSEPLFLVLRIPVLETIRSAISIRIPELLLA